MPVNKFLHLIITSIPSVFLLTLSSCAGIRTAVVDPDETFSGIRSDIVSSGRLSPETTQILRMSNLTPKEAVEAEYDVFSEALEKQHVTELQRHFAQSEFSLARGLALERRNSKDAARYFLRSIYHASLGALRPECAGPFDTRCTSFNAFYARATLGVLRRLRAEQWQDLSLAPAKQEKHAPTLLLRLNRDERSQAPEQFNFFEPSASIGLEGLPNRFRRFGVGLSLTACRKRREGIAFDSYIPRTGMCLPLTAIVEFPPDTCNEKTCSALLTLWNSFDRESIEVGEGKMLPLEADFSAPLAKLVERSGIGEWDGFFSALSGNEDLLKDTGFFTGQPYDPNKIPIITVHGLFSNPLTWISLQNDMMGDPVLRKHFQFWHYLYPTGLPILVNARDFRNNLDKLIEFMRSHGGSSHILVVAHSMGGLLTKTAVVNNSAPIKEVFFESLDKIEKLDEKTQKEVLALVDFSKKDFINRVIFVAVPHRGSDTSDGFAGWLGRMLMSLPRKFVESTATLGNSLASVVRPGVRGSLEMNKQSSIRALSPSNPVVQALAKIEVDPSIPFHSIIGDRGRGDGVNGSDGVVRYTSSHLEGAVSELIVPSNHTAQAHPLAVAEIKRILHLHFEAELKKQAETQAVHK